MASDDFTGELLPQRRRRAVVFADLVESVSMFDRFEARVLARWRPFVDVARTELVPARGGRMVRTAGDGLLIEAPDAGAAVRIGFALHEYFGRDNAGRPDDELMQLRVGIHVADVVIEDRDLQGAGVNLAARLTTLGQPGWTVLSEAARDGLVDELQAEFEDLGPRYVKGLREPVRAYAAHPAPAGGRTRALPSADDLRPAVAVVPFVALPADAEHDALGHAMADEIIATLARHPALRVLSRHSTAALRGLEVDLAHLHRRIGAPFLLSGRFHVHGQRIRLHAELCSLPDGAVLWSGSTSADIAALFEGSDELVPHVVAHVASQVLAHELARNRRLAMDALAPYSLYLGATGLMNSLVRQDFEHARAAFGHLIERHPRQAAPYAMLATWHLFRAMQGWSDDWQADAQATRTLADQALEIDPRQAAALAALGAALVSFSGEAEAGRACYEAAIEADPTESWAWARLAGALSHVGEHEAACHAAARAITLSPLDPSLFVFEAFAAMATLGAGRYGEAVGHAQSSVRRHALHAPSHRLLTAALWLDGRQADAQAAAQRYLALQPGATAGIRRAQSRGSLPVWHPQFVEALVAAGVPP